MKTKKFNLCVAQSELFSGDNNLSDGKKAEIVRIIELLLLLVLETSKNSLVTLRKITKALRTFDVAEDVLWEEYIVSKVGELGRMTIKYYYNLWVDFCKICNGGKREWNEVMRSFGFDKRIVKALNDFVFQVKRLTENLPAGKNFIANDDLKYKSSNLAINITSTVVTVPGVNEGTLPSKSPELEKLERRVRKLRGILNDEEITLSINKKVIKALRRQLVKSINMRDLLLSDWEKKCVESINNAKNLT